MPNKIILGFVGDLSSGKGTASNYLKDKYSANSYRFSTMLRDVAKRVYIETTRDNLQKLSTVLRENFGQDLLSKVMAEDVKNDPGQIVVVDGIRRESDITFLKIIEGFHLIYITADPKLRWERLCKRNENTGDSEKTYEEFLKDETAEADLPIKRLGQTAEVTLRNDGTVEEFKKELDKLVEKYS